MDIVYQKCALQALCSLSLLPDLSVCQELEDVSTQGEGHDLRVQQTQSNHPPHVMKSIQPDQRGLVAGRSGPGGVVPCLARLVEQGWLQGRAILGGERA